MEWSYIVPPLFQNGSAYCACVHLIHSHTVKIQSLHMTIIELSASTTFHRNSSPRSCMPNPHYTLWRRLVGRNSLISSRVVINVNFMLCFVDVIASDHLYKRRLANILKNRTTGMRYYFECILENRSWLTSYPKVAANCHYNECVLNGDVWV